jgi:ElaB/YqjD/DUF883 family membrane-anchored ribosome-binding protein
MSNYTEEIRKDVNALAKDARALAVDTGRMAGEKVGAARERLSVALENAQQSCDRMQQKTIDRMKAADKVVRNHPYQALGIALGIGAVIGFLFKRRKNGSFASEGQEQAGSV